MRVTPHAGVRIEMQKRLRLVRRSPSPPTRGCELKYCKMVIMLPDGVTPHAGVRIEMSCQRAQSSLSEVTPHAGVRIEMHILAPSRRQP